MVSSLINRFHRGWLAAPPHIKVMHLCLHNGLPICLNIRYVSPNLLLHPWTMAHQTDIGDIAIEAFTCLLVFKNCFSFALSWEGIDWLINIDGGIKRLFIYVGSAQAGICLLTVFMCRLPDSLLNSSSSGLILAIAAYPLLQ